MDKLLDTSELRDPLRERLRERPAGVRDVRGPDRARARGRRRPARPTPLGALDVTVRRNGYGRQRESFEADLTVRDLPGGSFRGVFIRAPKVERVGPGVEVLARARRRCRCSAGRTTSSSRRSIPSSSGDLRLHELFLREVQ